MSTVTDIFNVSVGIVHNVVVLHRMYSCQECLQNSALFNQFLSIFLTYVLFSYFVRLNCANIHTHSPSFSFLMT